MAHSFEGFTVSNTPHSASDPTVKIELLAVALDVCRQDVERRLNRGDIPPRTVRIGRSIKAWPLSTLRAWNPRVAKRLDMLLIALA